MRTPMNTARTAAEFASFMRIYEQQTAEARRVTRARLSPPNGDLQMGVIAHIRRHGHHPLRDMAKQSA